jgi:hypothetical protein
MAKAGFSDAIAEKLSQTDQGVVRTKIARNTRVKGLTRRKVLHAKARSREEEVAADKR